MDIVERLRSLNERFVFQGGSPFAVQLADEIERLRALESRNWILAAERLAEVERLRAEVAVDGEAWGRDQQRLKDAEAENARLRAKVALQKKMIGRLRDQRAERTAERDRLRAEVASLKDHVALQGKLIDDAEAVMRSQVAERDRLRELLREAREPVEFAYGEWMDPATKELLDRIDAALPKQEKEGS